MKLGIAGILAASFLACSPAKSPLPVRAQARAAVLTMADAVELADHLCATAVQGLKADVKPFAAVASKCIDGYQIARAALIDAEDALDVLDEVESNDPALQKIGCATFSILSGLSLTASALTDAGVHVPASVRDALSLGTWVSQSVGGSCAVGGKDAGRPDVGSDAPDALAPADAGAVGG